MDSVGQTKPGLSAAVVVVLLSATNRFEKQLLLYTTPLPLETAPDVGLSTMLGKQSTLWTGQHGLLKIY